MAFVTVPAGISSGATLAPVVVRLLDADGQPAVSYNGPVTLSLVGDGILTGTLTVDAVNGTATFDDLVLTGTGTFQLVATAAGLDPVTSTTFRSLALTELLVPQFIQGEQDATNDNHDRVPFAWRARIEGLEANATYRFANRVVLPNDAAENDGAGNMIFITSATGNWIRTTNSPRFRASDFGTRHYAFTANGSGAFTGWFLTEPSGNARFTPGNTLHFRLLLNDGTGGEETAFILTTNQSAQVIRFGTNPGEGTAIIGEFFATARRLVVLYDDADGTTRPLAATPVEITGAEVDSRYAAFYQNIVATHQGHWGTILPNTLPGGLRRIEIRAADSDDPLLDTRISGDGFPDTIDPGGGLDIPIVLNGSPTAYDQWRNFHFPDPAERADDAISGPNANHSGDDIANLIRYGHGVGPQDPVHHLLPRLVPADGGGFDFRYRFDSSKTDLAWIVRASTDLTDWSGVLFNSRSDAPPATNPDGRASLSVPAGSPIRFIRLELILD